MRKKICEICEFCERKKYPTWEIKLPNESHRPYLIEWVRSFSHRFTQMNRTPREQKDSGPSPDPSWPLPRPLPRREGEWSPRYPYGLDVGCFCLLIGIFIGSNVLWYLYAEGLLWVRNCAQKVLLDLWVLWEKEISFVKEGTLQRVS